MIILNFGHPLTESHISRIAQLVEHDIKSVIPIQSEIYFGQPLADQITQRLDALDIAPDHWQTGSWIVNLPSLNISAAVLMADLHGRMGYFPTCIRMQAVAGNARTHFEIVEVINLQQVRAQVRQSCR